jgi:hypothetical protein
MSYDALFSARNSTLPPTMNALSQWASTVPHFTVKSEDDVGTLSYKNGDTGVYFNLYRSSAGIDLNLNYCRPTFFAIETAEVMSMLATEFSLVNQLCDDLL